MSERPGTAQATPHRADQLIGIIRVAVELDHRGCGLNPATQLRGENALAEATTGLDEDELGGRQPAQQSRALNLVG